MLYGCYELWRAMRSAGIRISLLPILVGGAAALVAAWERGPNGLVLAVLVTFVGVLAWRIGDGAEGYARDVGASALALLYLPTLAAFAILLAHPHDGAARVLAFVATVVCSDTGGYATGCCSAGTHSRRSCRRRRRGRASAARCWRARPPASCS